MTKDYKIDLDIYPIDFLKEAIIAFSEVTKIVIDNTGILTINGDNEGEVDEVFNEFMNYNISLINE